MYSDQAPGKDFFGTIRIRIQWFKSTISGKKALVALVCVQEYRPYDESRGNLKGTLVDRKRMRNFFEQDFGYKVIVPQSRDGQKDLNRITRRDFDDFIEKVRKKYLSTNECDAFTFVFSGHGDQDSILLSDGHQGKYDRVELYKSFNGLQCPSFKDKPKMLLLGACKGADEAPDVNAPRSGLQVKARAIVRNVEKLSQAPDDNIIVIDSNSDRYVSWENNNGGYIFQALVDVMGRKKKRMRLNEVSKLITIGVKRLNNELKGLQDGKRRITETVVFKYYGVIDDIYFCT